MWTGLFPYACFVLDCTLHAKIWLCNIRETLRPPQLIRSDQLELPLETSCFVSTKILWYFVNFFLASEWAEDANWAHTHTHHWRNSWEKHQLLCVFIYSFEPFVFYLVSYSMIRCVELLPALHVLLYELPSNAVCAHFYSHVYFWARSQNCQKRLLASSCLFVHPLVCPHGTTRLPLDGLLWNLVFECPSKTCRERFSCIKNWQE
jgi:hypothetical protein